MHNSCHYRTSVGDTVNIEVDLSQVVFYNDYFLVEKQQLHLINDIWSVGVLWYKAFEANTEAKHFHNPNWLFSQKKGQCD